MQTQLNQTQRHPISTQTMKIFVLGGDGYLGWPLAMQLSRRYPAAQITVVDNLSRRAWVAEGGSDSLTPILSPRERVAAAREILGGAPIEFLSLDVTSPEFDRLMEERAPDLVYHLAQQPSAGFSMESEEHAILTAVNNETANLRMLWAARRTWARSGKLPRIIKLGSFGEYATFGLSVAEGYFKPTYRGKEASEWAPYPRAADDIYHVSKINDSNYIAMACRKWGLRVTEVMQSTVFGLHTPETRLSPRLCTRFDYDPNFGTVVNRFLVQAATGRPLTVYGTGIQRTGLMALEDAVASLADLAEAEHGKQGVQAHRVVNHVSEKELCILDIAEAVKAAARERGLSVELSVGRHNPRHESVAARPEHTIETPYLDQRAQPFQPFARVLGETLETVVSVIERARPEAFRDPAVW
jgi:UDP-sulfoquinovose synthase